MHSNVFTGARSIAALGALVTAMVLWLLFTDPGAEQAAVAATGANAGNNAKPPPSEGGVVLARRAPEHRAFAAGGSPYLLSAGPLERALDTEQLRRDLARTGKPIEDEVARQVALARYRDRMNMLGELLPGLGAEERRQETYEVLKRLPEHVAGGGIAPNEALLMTGALLEAGDLSPEIRSEFARQMRALLQPYMGQPAARASTTEAR